MMERDKLNISQWALEDRPREKMMLKGAEALSDAELLAILIGSGNTDESAVGLMQRVLAACDNNLNNLAKWEVHDFKHFKGMENCVCYFTEFIKKHSNGLESIPHGLVIESNPCSNRSEQMQSMVV